jgi:predicted ATPase with chaperone activity
MTISEKATTSLPASGLAALVTNTQPAREPAIPQSLEEAGVPAAMIEQLILKLLYFRSETLGRDLSLELGLKFSVIEETVEFLKRQHLVQVKKSMGMGAVSAVYSLTETGRQTAREYLEANQYAGHAPVPLDQYVEMVEAQRYPESWLTPEMLRHAFEHMVVTADILSQIGPAVNAGKSFLIYGQPGNGKTFLAEALFGLDPTPIFIPYAIEAQGMIIQLFDPLYHVPLEENEEDSLIAFAKQPTYDMRWIKVRRPFIVTGGELELPMLELSFNDVAKYYDAPLQLKANNGIYLIDDFGRQKATPAEILNRWIVPMERRIDYLTFKNGSKMHVPFECFLIFSSNLKPNQLGDEAFLRRIQYKMLMRNPIEDEFRSIFERFCAKHELPFDPPLLDRFLQRHYRSSGKKRRRCHPRDVITHAIDLIRFERRMWKLTDEVLDHAFATCFVTTDEDE